jgi:hypothetical protein
MFGLSTSNNAQKLQDEVDGHTGEGGSAGYGGMTINFAPDGYNGTPIFYQTSGKTVVHNHCTHQPRVAHKPNHCTPHPPRRRRSGASNDCDSSISSQESDQENNMNNERNRGKPGVKRKSHPSASQRRKAGPKAGSKTVPVPAIYQQVVNNVNRNTGPFGIATGRVTANYATPSPNPSPASPRALASPLSPSSSAADTRRSRSRVFLDEEDSHASHARTVVSTKSTTIEQEPQQRKLKGPSEARKRAINQILAAQRAEDRAPKTNALYGNVMCPAESKGYIGEFARWCQAGANEMVNGLLTDPTKTVYDVVPNMANVQDFMVMHFVNRPLMENGKFGNIKPMSKSGIDNCMKAMKALWDYQAKMYPGGEIAYTASVGRRPNDNGELTAMKASHSKKTAARRQEYCMPRGKGALCQDGYTKEQNRQLFEFGMTNISMQTAEGLTEMATRHVHTHHTLSHNQLLRFDDRKNLKWCQFCVTEPAEKMMKNGKLMTQVLDYRKTNREGRYEAMYAARHLYDPLRCSWFAIGTELYNLVHLLNSGFTPGDFLAVDNLVTGKIEKPWYDWYVFHGSTQCQRGQPSMPDETKPCCYSTVLSHFHKVYAQVQPPITGYHVLHLQRGAGAREAIRDGISHEQVGGAGCWKTGGSMQQNYLWSTPDEYVRYAAGYTDVMQKTGVYDTIARGCVLPPQSLIDKVFPYVRDTREAILQDPERWAKSNDTTLQGFFEFHDDLAVYLLQDLAVMKDRMSLHPMYGTELMLSVEFHEFREKLLMEMLNRKDEFKASHSIGASDPEVMVYLKKIYERIGLAAGSRFERKRKQQVIAEEDTEEILAPEDDDEDMSVLGTINTLMDRSEVLANADVSSDEEEADHLFFQKSLRTTNDTNLIFEAAMAGAYNRKRGVCAPCDLRDPSTWPSEVPDWAKSKHFVRNLKSPRDLATEYYEGSPPPALKDLEDTYGTHLKHVRKGNGWRSGQTKKEGNRMRRTWCTRKRAYDAMDEAGGMEPGIAALEVIVENVLSDLIPDGMTVKEPGTKVMTELLNYLKNQKEGAKERAEQGKKSSDEKKKKRMKIKEAKKSISAKRKINSTKTRKRHPTRDIWDDMSRRNLVNEEEEAEGVGMEVNFRCVI